MSAAYRPVAGAPPRSSSGTSAFVSRHALALVIALGAAIRFATIASQGFWLDEQVTVTLVQQPPIDLLRGVITGESNPSLYYVLQAAWERLFGGDEFGIRTFTALLGTAAIPLTYGAGRALYSRRAGLIAAALTATSPLLIWYSQEARNYEQLLFFSALSMWCFARALDDRGHRWLWGWALAASLALATHYFAFFLIVGQAAWLLWRRRGARLDAWMAIATVAIVGLALLPLTAAQRGRGEWIADYSLPGRLLNIPEHFIVGYQTPWPVVPVLGTALLLGVFAWALARADQPARRSIGVCAGILGVGAALLGLSVAAGDDYVLTRNVIELWPAAALAVAVALAGPRTARAGTLVVILACAGGAALAIWTALTPAARRPNYSELAGALGEASTPRLIVSQSSFSSPLLLYGDGIHAATEDELTTKELVVVSQRPTQDHSVGTCLWMPTCGGVDVEPPPNFQPPPGFKLKAVAQTPEFEYRTYAARHPTAIERPLELYTPRVFAQDPG